MNYLDPVTSPPATSTTPARAGRRPAAAGGGDSRAAILAAARSLFAARGFRGTTTRQIAQQAGVDIALIHHFFGTKGELFEAVVEFPRVGAQIADAITAPGDAAERLARLYLDELFVHQLETFSAVLRTAVGNPDDVPQLRDTIQAMLQRVAMQLGSRAASPLALELIGAQMIGVLIVRHLVGIEPMSSASTNELVRHLAPAFRALMAPDGAPDDTETEEQLA